MSFQKPRYKINPEQQLQESIVTLVRLVLPKVLFCASAGGLRTSKAQGIKMKRAGYVAGFPDLFFYEPRKGYHGLAIELKARASTSDAQKMWIKDLESRGYKAQVCRGADETIKALEEYFDIKID